MESLVVLAVGWALVFLPPSIAAFLLALKLRHSGMAAWERVLLQIGVVLLAMVPGLVICSPFLLILLWVLLHEGARIGASGFAQLGFGLACGPILIFCSTIAGGWSPRTP